MAKIFDRLLGVIALATDRELARQVKYLKVENEILRAKLPKRITVTKSEQARLVKFGKKLGPAMRHLITIVSPRTFARWVNGESKRKKAKSDAKPGRPKIAEEVRKLVIKLAKETGWGYSRSLGELKKLGVRKISRQTVKNIMVENGFDPAPKRGEGTWDDFIKRHAKTLWACDYFSKKIVTPKGLIDCFMVVFIHVASRKIFVTPSTPNPDNVWAGQQARNFAVHLEETQMTAIHLVHDRDSKFTAQFKDIMKSNGVERTPIAFCAPNMNPFAKRVVHESTDSVLSSRGQHQFDRHPTHLVKRVTIVRHLLGLQISAPKLGAEYFYRTEVGRNGYPFVKIPPPSIVKRAVRHLGASQGQPRCGAGPIRVRCRLPPWCIGQGPESSTKPQATRR